MTAHRLYAIPEWFQTSCQDLKIEKQHGIKISGTPWKLWSLENTKQLAQLIRGISSSNSLELRLVRVELPPCHQMGSMSRSQPAAIYTGKSAVVTCHLPGAHDRRLCKPVPPANSKSFQHILCAQRGQPSQSTRDGQVSQDMALFLRRLGESQETQDELDTLPMQITPKSIPEGVSPDILVLRSNYYAECFPPLPQKKNKKQNPNTLFVCAFCKYLLNISSKAGTGLGNGD